MADPQIWYLQDGSVQSQAGKVFQHQQGPLLKFPEQSDSVDNSCLCKYRYMRYYAFYQRVDQSNSQSLVFFEDLTSNSLGIINYSTQLNYGYNWKLHSGPHYLGCHPAGTFTLGTWLPVDLPYIQMSNALLGNTTSPSPYYIYETHQPTKASLKCMIVCSYKCCNGQKGCGIEIPRGSSSWSYNDLPICVADYYVTKLDAALRGSDSASAALIEGTKKCCVHSYQKKEVLLDCTSAIVRVSHDINLLPSDSCQKYCPDCFTFLPAEAIKAAMHLARQDQCVYWHLWVFSLSNCDPCAVNQITAQQVHDFTNIPPQVVGKGGGYAPKSWHESGKKFTYCSQTGGTVYQWNYTENLSDAIVPPVNLTQNPCQNYCQGHGRGNTISDSLAGLDSNSIPKSQLPCNSPDPWPRQYIYFNFQPFDLYYLKLSKAEPGQGGQEQDPCHPTYKIDPTSLSDGKLKWTKYVSQKLDYELQREGFFKGTQFLHFKCGSNGDCRFYLAVSLGDDPPQNPSDSRLRKFNPAGSNSLFIQDPSQNLCDFLYQVYFTGCKCEDPCKSDSCSTLAPYITGGCTKWAFKGRKSDQQIQAVGVCLDKWAISTHANTFTDEDSPLPGQLVYSVKSDKQDYCQGLPSAPDKLLWYAVAKVQPKLVDGSIQQQVTWSHQNVSFGICQKTAQNFKQGWKASPGPSDSLLPAISTGGVTIVEPGEACQIYYLKLIKTAYDAATSPACVVVQPQSQEYSDSALLDNVMINWSQQCIKHKWCIAYYRTTVTPYCQSDAIYTAVSSPQLMVKQFPSSLPQGLKYGWALSQQWPPLVQGDLQVEGDLITEQVITVPDGVCKLYYFSKLQQKLIGQEDSCDYSGSVQTDPLFEPPAVIWDHRCVQKYYIRIAYLQAEAHCSSDSKPQETSSSWLFSVQELQSSDSSQFPTPGWYDGKLDSFKGKTPVYYNNTTFQYQLTKCEGTYLAVVDRIGWSCSPPVPSTEPPQWRAGKKWPQKCTAKNVYYAYCISQVYSGCSNSQTVPVFMGFQPWVSSDSVQQGWYTGPQPTEANRLSASDSLPCTGLYYVQFMFEAQACTKQGALGMVTCSDPPYIDPSKLRWKPQCYTDGIWYQYKEITRACVSDAAGYQEGDWEGLKLYTCQDEFFDSFTNGYYDQLPEEVSLQPVIDDTPDSCTVYYIYKRGIKTCGQAVPEIQTAADIDRQTLAEFIWPDDCMQFKHFYSFKFFKAHPECSSDGLMITVWESDSLYEVSSDSIADICHGIKSSKDYTCDSIVYGPGESDCEVYQLPQGGWAHRYSCHSDAYPALPAVTHSDYSFPWGQKCLQRKNYYAYYRRTLQPQCSNSAISTKASEWQLQLLSDSQLATAAPPWYKDTSNSCLKEQWWLAQTYLERCSAPDGAQTQPPNDFVVPSVGWPQSCIPFKYYYTIQWKTGEPQCSSDGAEVRTKWTAEAPMQLVSSDSISMVIGLKNTQEYTAQAILEPGQSDCKAYYLDYNVTYTCTSNAYPEVPSNSISSRNLLWSNKCMPRENYYAYYSRELKPECVNGIVTTRVGQWSLQIISNSQLDCQRSSSLCTKKQCKLVKSYLGYCRVPTGEQLVPPSDSIPYIQWSDSCTGAKDYYLYYYRTLYPYCEEGNVQTRALAWQKWLVEGDGGRATAPPHDYTDTSDSCWKQQRRLVKSYLNYCSAPISDSTVQPPSDDIQIPQIEWSDQCTDIKYHYTLLWKIGEPQCSSDGAEVRTKWTAQVKNETHSDSLFILPGLKTDQALDGGNIFYPGEHDCKVYHLDYTVKRSCSPEDYPDPPSNSISKVNFTWADECLPKGNYYIYYWRTLYPSCSNSQVITKAQAWQKWPLTSNSQLATAQPHDYKDTPDDCYKQQWRLAKSYLNYCSAPSGSDAVAPGSDTIIPSIDWSDSCAGVKYYYTILWKEGTPVCSSDGLGIDTKWTTYDPIYYSNAEPIGDILSGLKSSRNYAAQYNILSPGQSDCQVFYLDYKVKHTCTPGGYPPVPSDSVDSWKLPWSNKCVAFKYYYTIVWKTGQPFCASNSVQIDTKWTTSTDQLYSSDSMLMIKGLKNTQEYDKGNIYAPGQSDCQVYYLDYAVKHTCTPGAYPPAPSNSVNSWKLPWSQNCVGFKTYTLYCSLQVQLQCLAGDALGKVTGDPVRGILSDSTLTTGWYSSVVPSAATKIQGNKKPCPVYYICTQQRRLCARPKDPQITCTIGDTYGYVTGIQWESDCLDVTWYQYKKIQHTCSDAGSIINVIDSNWTVNSWERSNYWTLHEGVYNKLPGNMLQEVVNNIPSGCVVYYIHKIKDGTRCQFPKPTADNSVLRNSQLNSAVSALNWQNCPLNTKYYYKLAWFKAVPSCSNSTITSSIAGPFYQTLSNSTQLSLYGGWRNAQNYSAAIIPGEPSGCEAWCLWGWRKNESCKPVYPDDFTAPSPSVPSFKWTNCGDISTYYNYRLRWWRVYPDCNDGQLITKVQYYTYTELTELTSSKTIIPGLYIGTNPDGTRVSSSSPGNNCVLYYLDAFTQKIACTKGAGTKPFQSEVTPGVSVTWGSSCLPPAAVCVGSTNGKTSPMAGVAGAGYYIYAKVGQGTIISSGTYAGYIQPGDYVWNDVQYHGGMQIWYVYGTGSGCEWYIECVSAGTGVSISISKSGSGCAQKVTVQGTQYNLTTGRICRVIRGVAIHTDVGIFTDYIPIDIYCQKI